MSMFALKLAVVLGRPVADKTNEERNFDFHLRWAPDDATPSDDPSLFAALVEQAGLRLVS
jgi:uncharacterized protein (TIGR03435 family)